MFDYAAFRHTDSAFRNYNDTEFETILRLTVTLIRPLLDNTQVSLDQQDTPDLSGYFSCDKSIILCLYWYVFLLKC